ncbi:MAG: RnfABCDGE type electron transport complex subunit D [Alkalispirochaeta sp.]|jgi:electron transport complex protein RnfD
MSTQAARDGLIVALPPHERSDVSVARIMWSVVLALVPTTLVGVYFYGLRALAVTLVAVGSSVVVEHLIVRYLFHRETTTITDGSAVVTGMLLAFNVPAGIPLWQIVVGAVIAIGVAKMAFGGIGNNPFNPALVGRAFMLVSFPVDMTTWPVPGAHGFAAWNLDAVTAATPLGLIKEAAGGGLAAIADQLPSYGSLFIGNVGGCIGEVSALAVLIGGLFLIWRGFIPWMVPFVYLAGLAVVTGVAWLIDPTTYIDPLYHILAGGAMLGAWFMVTDMTTSPMSILGQIVFAGAAGILAGVIRLFGGFPEGVSYSILIMNAFVPVIDRHIKPRKFGYGKTAPSKGGA